MVFVKLVQICIYITIFNSMKKMTPVKMIHNIMGPHVSILKNSHNWKLLLDSPFSETGW
jgi:hypothetical protein